MRRAAGYPSGLPAGLTPSSRPIVTGDRGAVAAAHPLATAAAQAELSAGGNAVDAAVAAQAVLCVVAPHACGLGGDALFIVGTGEGQVTAVTGAGRLPGRATETVHRDGGGSATVPGIVRAWTDVLDRWGTRPLAKVLEMAVRLAERGVVAGPDLAAAARRQRQRLVRGGAAEWPVTNVRNHVVVRQQELARTLRDIGAGGADAFYSGSLGEAIARAAQADGGVLEADDLAAHRSLIAQPLSLAWGNGMLWVQPPPSQGVLLAMACRWIQRAPDSVTPATIDHVAVELTEAVFAHRHRASEGTRLLELPIEVDLERALRRGGPRSYLHTAGVAVADQDGLVVSSLVSVFDDFGGATFVPEGGFTLNNRAGGFTEPPNDCAPDKRPVHTLAPLLVGEPGVVTALATPGADGQIQTLLQVLLAMRFEGHDLAEAIARPRWRSEDGVLLVEESFDRLRQLRERGHRIRLVRDGDERAGAVVAAGADARPFAAGDWRRTVWAGVA